MFDSYNSENLTAFNFSDLYEGKILEVKDTNKCLIHIYKFFLTSETGNNSIVGNNPIDFNNIENGNSNITEIQSTNGILCDPLYTNTMQIKPNIGDDVLVFFFNGDPQRPYYINGYLEKELKKLNEDTIYNSADVSIKVKNGEDPYIVFKIKDNEIKFDANTALGNTLIVNSGNGSGEITTIFANDVNLINTLQRLNIKKEFAIIKDSRDKMQDICSHFNMQEQFTAYDETYNNLAKYLAPILLAIDENKEINIDANDYNKNFVNYYMAYNELNAYILKNKTGGGGFGSGSGSGGGFTTNDGGLDYTTVENIESTIRDLIYTVDSTINSQLINEMVADGILTVREKQTLAEELLKIYNEYNILESFAPLHYDSESFVYVAHTDYKEGYKELTDYINPIIADSTNDTEVDKDEFLGKFNNYFKLRVELYDQIYTYSSELLNNALSNIKNNIKDGVLTESERNTFLATSKIPNTEYEYLCNLAALYNVNTRNYTLAYNSLAIFRNLYDSCIGLSSINDSDLKKLNDNAEAFVKERNNLLARIIAVSNSYIKAQMEGSSFSGGANLLVNSAFKYEDKKWSYPTMSNFSMKSVDENDIFGFNLATDVSEFRGTLATDFFKASKGEYLVLSFWANVSNAEVPLQINILDSAGNEVMNDYNLYLNPSENGEYKKYIVPITITKDIAKNISQRPQLVFRNNGYFYIEITHIKLEFGTLNSDWTPCNEDKLFDEENYNDIFQHFSSSITQTIDKINMTVEGFTSEINKIVNETEGFKQTIEEFRQQQSDFTIKIDEITGTVSDVAGRYEELEQMVQDADIDAVKKTLETFSSQISGFEVTLNGFNTRVEHIEGSMETVLKLSGDIIKDYGSVENFMGTITEWGATVDGIGGRLSSVESSVTTNKNLIDNLTKTSSSLQQDFLTMKGSLDEIEQSIASMKTDIDTVNNALNGTNTEIINIKENYAGIVTTLDSITQRVSSAESNITVNTNKITDLENANKSAEETIQNINKHLSEIQINNDNITTIVNNITQQIQTLETNSATSLINDFSASGNLKRWYPTSEEYIDDEGNLVTPEPYELLTLEESITKNYQAYIDTKTIASVYTDKFDVDPNECYKFSFYTKTDKYVGTDVKYKAEWLFFDAEGNRIGCYLNTDTTITENNLIITEEARTETDWNLHFGWLVSQNVNTTNELFLIKGNSNNAFKLPSNVKMCQLKFTVENMIKNGEDYKRAYLASPRVNFVDSLALENNSKLQEAYIKVQDDAIIQLIRSSAIIQTPDGDITLNEAYNKTVSTTTAINTTLNEYTSKTDILSNNYATLDQRVTQQNTTINGLSSTVGSLKNTVDALSQASETLSIVGENVFVEDEDGVITPQSITLVALKSSAVTIGKWTIDDVEVTGGLNADKTELIITRSYLVGKNSIVVKCYDTTGSNYDIFTIYKVTKSKDSITIILSNEFIGIPTDSQGNNGDYSRAKTTIKVYEGGVDKTSAYTFSATPENSSLITASLIDNTYTITDLKTDSMSIELSATKNLVGTYTKTLMVSKVKKGEQGLNGIQGEQGVPGPTGADGRTTYFHVKFSMVPNPTSADQMQEDPAIYIGTYVDFIEEDSNDPSMYKWSRHQGTEGIPGENGQDGKTSYLHIKYSNDGGKTFTANNGEDVGDWIGQYVDFEEKDSNDLTKYKWKKIVGDIGVSPVNIILTNEHQGFITDTFGYPLDDAEYITDILVYKGSTQITDFAIGTIPFDPSLGITVNIHDSLGMTGNKYIGFEVKKAVKIYGTHGSFDIPITVEGNNYIKKFTWTCAANGKDGSGVNIKGSLTSESELPTTGQPGDAYLIDGILWVWDSVNNKFVNAGNIRGPQGLPGLQGPQGEQGIQGPTGPSGSNTYFHVKYSDVENPTSADQMKEPPGIYMGTYVDSIEQDSDDPSKYTWIKVKGLDGIPGKDGTNGITYYLHIKYSDDNGQTFTGNNGENVGYYIGTLVDTTEADSDNPADYKWAKIKGEDGIQGPSGEDGRTSYFHVKYSSVAHPVTADQMQEEPAMYIGTYVDFIEADSNDPLKYKWSKFEGIDGIPGVNGEDGTSSYLHIKYSNDGGFTFTGNNGEDFGDYMGQCVTREPEDPTDINAYTWVKIKGEQGIQGPAGPSGKTTYFHVKYASNGNPTAAEMTETINDYIGTYVDFVEEDSADPTKYTWSKFIGKDGTSVRIDGTKDTVDEIKAIPNPEIGSGYICAADGHLWTYTVNGWIDAGRIQGPDGIPGKDGIDGKTYYLHIKYSNDGGETFTANNGETPGDYMGQYVDEIEADSNDVTKYKWKKIKGEQGADAKLVSLTPSSQMFKSTDGGATFFPDQITIVVYSQGVTLSNWQYSTNGGSTWNNITSGQHGLTIKNNKDLVISKNSDLFTSDKTAISFKLNSNDALVYDIVTIVKIYDVTDIKVGGRNYLRGTANETKILGNNSTSQAVQLCGLINSEALYDKDCIISFEWSMITTSGNSGTFKIKTGSNYNADLTTSIDVSKSNSEREVFKFKLPKVDGKSFSILQVECANLVGTLSIKLVKVEIGTVATDWTPATEDMEEVVDNLTKEVQANSSFISQNKDRILNSVQQSTFNQTIANINTDMNKLNTGLNKWLCEKFTMGASETGYDINNIMGKISSTSELNDALSQTTNVNANTLVKYTTCLYATSGFTIQVGNSLNNKGNIYFNSMKIRDAHDNSSDTNSFTLVPGWNTIEILTRGINTTGFTFNKKLSEVEGVVVMNCYAVDKDYTRMTKAESEITPESITNKVSGTFVLKDDYSKYVESNNQAVQDAQNAANNAQSSADKAQQAADKANADISNIASDSVLTPLEKQQLKLQMQDIIAEKEAYIKQAQTYGISTSEYEKYYNVLYEYCYNSTAGVLNNMTNNTNIDPTILQSRFANYYTQRTNLLNSLAQSSKDYSDLLNDTINNMTIGGRNLIKNSAFVNNNVYGWNLLNNWTLDTNVKLNGHPSAKISVSGLTSDSYLGLSSNSLVDTIIHQGVTYTVSCWYYVKDKATIDNNIGLEIKGRKVNATTDSTIGGLGVASTAMTNEKWTKISATFTPTEDYNNCYVYAFVVKNGTIWLTDFKLEKGNKATDWTPAPEDTETYVDNLAADLQEQVDGKIETWSQSSDPSTAWTTTDLKTNHTGDIWYNTSTKETKRWSGTAWVLLENKEAQDASALASKKAQVFTGTPTIPYYKGDLWITSTTSKQGVVKTCITTRTSGSYTASDWVENLKYTDDTLASKIQTDLNNLTIGGRNYIKNGKGDVKAGFFTAFDSVSNGYGTKTLTSKKSYTSISLSPGYILNIRDWTPGKTVVMSFDIMFTTWDFPSGTNTSEWWIGQRYTNNATSNGNGAWRGVTQFSMPSVGYDGCELNKWYHFSKTATIPAQADADVGSQAAIQFYNSSDTATATITFRMKNVKIEYGNRATDWSPAPEDTETYVDNLVADLQEQVDGKIETFSQSSDPSTAWTTTDLKNKHAGDIWYNTSTKETKRWSGTAWVLLQNKEAQDASALASKKAQVFTGTPTIPYYKGDLWITSTTSKQGVVKTCVTTRTSGSYTASDWVENLKYTDDTAANNVQNNLNNLTIGGRNLFLKSNIDQYGLGNWINNGTGGIGIVEGTFIDGTKTIKITGSDGIQYNSYIKLKRNTSYVYSMMMKSSGSIIINNSNPLHMWLNTSESSAHLENVISTSGTLEANKWKKVWVIFKTPDTQDVYYLKPFIYGIDTNTVYICKVQIEEGNKATDWKPAPEDVQSSITSVQNQINDIASDSKLTPSEKQELDRQMQDIINEKTTYVSQASTYSVDSTAYVNAYNSLYNYCYGTSGVLTSLTTTTAITASTLRTNFSNYFNARNNLLTAIMNKTKSYTDTSINNIVIGGRNLISYTDVAYRSPASGSYNKSTNTWTITAKAGSGDSWGVGLYFINRNILIPFGKTYTVSMEVKVPRACMFNMDVNNYAATGSSWNGN